MLLRPSSCARRKQSGKHWHQRSIRIITRSKFCSIFSKVCHRAEVRITAYNQSARQISVDGEANTAALAYQFIEKIKKNPDLRVFQFDMAAPRILPNNHAQFRLEGKAKMMPAWYQRMNPRERLLAWIVAGTVFVLLNLWILNLVFGALGSAQKQMATRRSKLSRTSSLRERTRPLDKTRRVAPATSTNVLKNPAEASALLDQLKRSSRQIQH